MKGEKVRDLDSKELATQVREITDQLFHLRFQMRMGQMEGLKKFRNLKKDRARMMTVLRERELAESAKVAGSVEEG